MSTETRRLSEELKVEHAELLDAEHKLAHALTIARSYPASERSRLLLPAVQEYSRHLLRHLQCEETDGFLEPVLDQDPCYSRQVEALHREHEEIRTQLRRITAGLDERARDPEELRLLIDDIRCFLVRLHRHDLSESALVLDAFWTDEPAGD